MKKFIEKLIGRLEEISVSRDNDGVINGCNMGICEDDDCLKCLKKKVISIVNQLAEEYKDKEYCWQECASTEHCKECSRLGNGDIDYFESIDDWAESLPTIDAGELFGKTEQVKDGWIPYTDKSYPKVGRIIDVWLTLEDGVYKAVWNGSDFEWENGRVVTDKIFAWMDNSMPKPYQPKGE